MRVNLVRGICLALTIVAVGCGGSTQPKGDDAPAAGVASGGGSSTSGKADYPVFPDADKGADPAVPAEQGGRGFKGEGWTTNTRLRPDRRSPRRQRRHPPPGDAD